MAVLATDMFCACDSYNLSLVDVILGDGSQGATKATLATKSCNVMCHLWHGFTENGGIRAA